MAANYWDSTQRRYWTFTRSQLNDIRQKVEDQDRNLIQQYPLPDRRLLHIYFSHRMEPLYHQTKLATAFLTIPYSYDQGGPARKDE